MNEVKEHFQNDTAAAAAAAAAPVQKSVVLAGSTFVGVFSLR